MGRSKKINGAARPFLKWVGGKRQLLPYIRQWFPSEFNRYHEPFVGGGAVFFDLNPNRAVLLDSNQELVDSYIAVRDQVEKVIEKLAKHNYDKDHFYRVRAQNPNKLQPVNRAARMIYLNKAGFNGLYRVNSKGKFNVPFGRHVNPNICDAHNLRAVSDRLKKVEIRCDGFERILVTARKGDFIYFDPPYIPLSKTASFVAYQKRGFGMEKQEKLAEVFEALDRRGCSVMLSNSDVHWMRLRYKNFRVHRVKANRHVNANAASRGPVGEIIVTNY